MDRLTRGRAKLSGEDGHGGLVVPRRPVKAVAIGFVHVGTAMEEPRRTHVVEGNEAGESYVAGVLPAPSAAARVAR